MKAALAGILLGALTFTIWMSPRTIHALLHPTYMPPVFTKPSPTRSTR